MARTPIPIPQPQLADPGALAAINEALEAEGGSQTGQPPDDLMSAEHTERPPDKPKYDRWMRPERPVERENGGIDEETGWRYEWRAVGMVRNASAETRKRMKVYLDPIPHVVLDQHVPLRGWYQNKFEPSQVRPRPCLLPDAKVDTPWGPREIKDLQVGDLVLGYDEASRRFAPTYVQGVAKQVKQEYLEVELEDGRILRLTPEHLVFTKARGWVEAQALTEDDDILDLKVQYNSGYKARLCGIYALINERDGKIYVGSAKDILGRVKNHLKELKAGRHSNLHLQASYRRGDVFRPVVLEVCSEDVLVAREQHYIDHHDSCEKTSGYNLTIAGRTVVTPEGRERIAAYRRGKTLEELWGSERAAERRAELRAQVGEKNPNYGNRGERHPNYGKTNVERFGPEEAARLAAITTRALKGKRKSKAARAKISAAHKGKVLTEEHKRGIAAGLARAKAEGRREHRLSEADRVKISKTLRRKYARGLLPITEAQRRARQENMRRLGLRPRTLISAAVEVSA